MSMQLDGTEYASETRGNYFARIFIRVAVNAQRVTLINRDPEKTKFNKNSTMHEPLKKSYSVI